MIEESGSEIPLPKPGLTVGIIYNLKKGLHTHVVDAEAEYDNIDTVYAIQKALEAGGAKAELLEADKYLPEKLGNADRYSQHSGGLYGRGREAQIPALLNMLGIPFTGSDETTLCIALDKALTKRLLATYHIHTPRYGVLTKGNMHAIDGFKYPVIVKPNAEGSSKGISDISVVETRKALVELAKQNIAFITDF